LGVDLRAVQRHRAHLQHAHLARQQKDLDEQPFDLLQEPSAERRDRVVVGMVVGGDEAERHAVIGRPLQLAARKHARRIAVNQKAEQHRRTIGLRAGAAIIPAHRAKVEPVDHLHDEARQMPLRNPFVHGRRQQKSGVPVNRAEVGHRHTPVVR